MKKYIFIFLFFILTIFFFKDFVFFGKLPIPSDTIIGLYHPFRDLYSKNYPNGISYKNFLITDPVRQQFPWRNLSIDLIKKGAFPIWNPYVLSGSPLLANFQSAAFYPLNLLFFIFPFDIGWSLLIVVEPFLAGIFMYLYLNNLKLNKFACFLGGLVYGFCGFSVSWMEWGTIGHVILWLPLLLLAIDKITLLAKEKKFSIFNFQFSIWFLIFVFSLISSFFAGHLQIFFYVFSISLIYLLSRWFLYGRQRNIFLLFSVCYFLFAVITILQWLPTFRFILFSARDLDQANWLRDGWFIPWQNLIQFLVPDFFGNPTTLNYWGVWNYGEFIAYVGILPLTLSVFALFFRKDKKTLFYGTLFFISLIFSLPTIFAKIPYILSVPFLSTAQPTRLLFLTDFSLAVLSALGLDFLFRSRKQIIYPLISIFILFLGCWIFVYLKNIDLVPLENLSVAKRNLYFPTIIFGAITVLLLLCLFFFQKKKIRFVIVFILLAITIFDLFRFGWKFLPFTNKDYLFPATKTTFFLQNNVGFYRIMTTDSRILPPNFSIMYKLYSIDGYDPLYLARYGELIAASERGRPDISPPFGFNRIITPHKYDSKIVNLLGVKYVLSLSEIESDKLKKVFQEGQTRIYENKDVLPRTFFVKQIRVAVNDKTAIQIMFEKNFNFRDTVVVDDPGLKKVRFGSGEAIIINYSANKVIVKTESADNSFLVLTDSFYPTWHAKIDNSETKIYRADYNFKGVVVPKGDHLIEFYPSLF